MEMGPLGNLTPENLFGWETCLTNYNGVNLAKSLHDCLKRNKDLVTKLRCFGICNDDCIATISCLINYDADVAVVKEVKSIIDELLSLDSKKTVDVLSKLPLAPVRAVLSIVDIAYNADDAKKLAIATFISQKSLCNDSTTSKIVSATLGVNVCGVVSCTDLLRLIKEAKRLGFDDSLIVKMVSGMKVDISKCDCGLVDDDAKRILSKTPLAKELAKVCPDKFIESIKCSTFDDVKEAVECALRKKEEIRVQCGKSVYVTIEGKKYKVDDVSTLNMALSGNSVLTVTSGCFENKLFIEILRETTADAVKNLFNASCTIDPVDALKLKSNEQVFKVLVNAVPDKETLKKQYFKVILLDILSSVSRGTPLNADAACALECLAEDIKWNVSDRATFSPIVMSLANEVVKSGISKGNVCNIDDAKKALLVLAVLDDEEFKEKVKEARRKEDLKSILTMLFADLDLENLTCVLFPVLCL